MMRKGGVAVVLESERRQSERRESNRFYDLASKWLLPPFLVVARITLDMVIVLAVSVPA